MSNSGLMRGLYGMHFRMMTYSTIWGFATGAAIGDVSTRFALIPYRAAWVIVGAASLLWLFALIAPMVFQLYKYVLPTALPLALTMSFGIAGMAAGYALSMVARIIGDLRRFTFIAESYAKMGTNPPGLGPRGYSPRRDIIARPLVGAVVAGTVLAWTLGNGFGVTLTDPGVGTFSRFIDSDASALTGQLAVFCLMWGLQRQLFESGVDIWTTPRLLSLRH